MRSSYKLCCMARVLHCTTSDHSAGSSVLHSILQLSSSGAAINRLLGFSESKRQQKGGRRTCSVHYPIIFFAALKRLLRSKYTMAATGWTSYSPPSSPAQVGICCDWSRSNKPCGLPGRCGECDSLYVLYVWLLQAVIISDTEQSPEKKRQRLGHVLQL